MKGKHNFSAGPAILPAEVIQEAAAGVLNINNTGLSILEVSHRDKDFMAIMEEARSLVTELMGLGSEYKVLFLGGGASLQFAMVPSNLLVTGGTAAYVDTGVWAHKAIKEAKLIGNINVVASSENEKYNHIPKNFTIPTEANYLHITSNNTIYGTQIHHFPDSPIPVVCDMSSDIFSRRVDFNKFSLIYAGTQKNMGAAGATMVVVKESILGKTGRKMFSMLDYQVHIKGESMYNTPPVFSVYACLLTMRWLKKNGGLGWIEEINRRKAELMYSEIDRNSIFMGTVVEEDRSWMNATFLLTKPELEETFNKMWKEAGIVGIKGHRDVGGYRASMYNALTVDDVQALVDVMKELEKKNG
ncbi:MAG TPA: 3-phosphoserine/phosphohydroxythreonine transaminase [Bacteroidia bacterium]|jgi:phosphoserine aminotransferase|nr:3-phosphoserine/phosphohydroxythreonine transaminase [Bacteroidia bacterium]